MRFVKSLMLSVAMLSVLSAPSYALDVKSAVKRVVGVAQEVVLMPVHVGIASAKAGVVCAKECVAKIKEVAKGEDSKVESE